MEQSRYNQLDVTSRMHSSPLSSALRRACPACGLQLDISEDICPQDGTRLSVPVEEEPVFRDKYEFLGTIATGGMGIIYKARQSILRQLVAIKMLHSHLLTTEALQRFEIEGRAASMLQHRFIVGVHDFGLTSVGQPYMVMDYIEGRTLAQVFEQDGALGKERFLHLFIQVCEALSHAHKRSVLHRDIKPSNIMVVVNDKGEEEVRIMDFGIAKLLTDSQSTSMRLTRTGEAVGSPLYMSPEQVQGIALDPRSDLYSLGCVMYEALTCTAPFVAETAFEIMLMQVNQNLKPPLLDQAVRGAQKLDPALEPVVSRLLEKHKEARFATMDELRSELRAIFDTAGGERTAARSAREVEKSKRRWFHSPWVHALIVICACFGIGLLYELHVGEKIPSRSVDTNGGPPVECTARTLKVGALIDEMVRRRETDLDIRHAGAAQPFFEAFAEESVKRTDFAALQYATNALAMELRKSKIDDDALKYIRNLELEKLDLSQTRIQKLSALKNMKTLACLDVSGTAVDHDGMAIIGGLTNLQALNLSCTAITDKDLERLVPLKSLRLVQFTDCRNLSPPAVEALVSSLPKCKVSFMINGQPGAIAVGSQSPAQSADSTMLAKATSLFQKRDFVGAEHTLKEEEARLMATTRNQKPSLLVLVQVTLSDAQFAQGHFQDALMSINAAIATATKHKIAHTLLPQFYFKKGRALRELNRMAEAIEAYKTAEALFKQLEVQAGGTQMPQDWLYWRGHNAHNMAISQEIVGAKDQSIDWAVKAIQYYRQCGLEWTRINGQCAGLIATVYCEKGNRAKTEAERDQHYRNAITYFELAQAIFQGAPDQNTEELIAYETSLALLYNLTKAYDKAEALLVKMLAQPCSDSLRLAEYRQMVLLYNGLHREDLVRVYKQKSHALAKKLKVKP